MTTTKTQLSIIGLMSGTSVDGIDAALVHTDGESLMRTPHAITGDYAKATKQAILALVDNPEPVLANRDNVMALEQMIAQDHAVVVNELMQQANTSVDLLGFHGQTVFHDPDSGVTFQLGDAKMLSELTGVNTVYGFRLNDMAQGGQGAPLAPIYHQYLLGENKINPPAAFLNIGGISNASVWDGKQLIGFDCGPGNCLMDDYMRQHFDRSYDEQGEVAASGCVDQSLLEQWMRDPYFVLAPPKSLDRQYFSKMLDSVGGLDPVDAMATLNAFTARSIAESLQRLPTLPNRLVVAGGGQHNKVLLNAISTALGGTVTVSTADELGLNGDYIEAELMAYLAARHHYQLPYTFPGTTGARGPCTGGITIALR